VLPSWSRLNSLPKRFGAITEWAYNALTLFPFNPSRRKEDVHENQIAPGRKRVLNFRFGFVCLFLSRRCQWTGSKTGKTRAIESSAKRTRTAAGAATFGASAERACSEYTQ